MRSYWRGEYLQELSDAAIDTFLGARAALTAADVPAQPDVSSVSAKPSPPSPTKPPSPTATPPTCSTRSRCWQDAADDERLIAATARFADAMRPFGTGGAYLNFTPESDRVRDAYGDEKYARLVELKNRYDPANLFRLNQNIRPSQAMVAPA